MVRREDDGKACRTHLLFLESISLKPVQRVGGLALMIRVDGGEKLIGVGQEGVSRRRQIRDCLVH
jgi:hypothetical protein